MMQAPGTSPNERLKDHVQAKYIALLTSCQISILVLAIRVVGGALSYGGHKSAEQIAQLIFWGFAEAVWPAFVCMGLLNVIAVRAMTVDVPKFWKAGAQIWIGSFLAFGALSLLLPYSMGKSYFVPLLSTDCFWLLVLVAGALCLSTTWLGLKFGPGAKLALKTSKEPEPISGS